MEPMGDVINSPMAGADCAIPEGKEDFEIYCCYNCGRLISCEQEAAAMKSGVVCSCGSVRYRPVKVLDAEPNEAGDYVVTGRYGEKVVLAKATFEAAYRPLEVSA